MKLAVTLATIVALASVASADKKERADALFKEGKKLMGEKRYSDACNAFEESFKLDPGIGAQLNIAKCYEEWGKLGRAYLSYQAAEKAAREASPPDPRADKIKEIITELDTQVPRLTVKLPKDAPKGFQVTMDKKPITVLGEAFVVDPGPKTLEWWVGNGPKKQKIVSVERGGESEVTLDVPKGTVIKPEGGGEGDGKGDGNGDVEPTPEPEKASVPGRAQRIGGIALGGAGVLAIGVSSVMTLSARGKYNDALDMYCNGMKNTCNAQGLDITHDARSTANTATVIFLVGVAAVGGGVALYLLAPKASSASPDDEGGDEEAMRYVVPSVSPEGAGLVYGGRF
jgi:tetratricopeptide (TPR) repeat protein